MFIHGDHFNWEILYKKNYNLYIYIVSRVIQLLKDLPNQLIIPVVFFKFFYNSNVIQSELSNLSKQQCFTGGYKQIQKRKDVHSFPVSCLSRKPCECNILSSASQKFGRKSGASITQPPPFCIPLWELACLQSTFTLFTF